VFIGYTHPFKTQVFGKPIELFSFADYETWFGGFFANAVYDGTANNFGSIAHAVNQFFLNGGSICHVVGLPAPPATTPSPAAMTIPSGTGVAKVDVTNGSTGYATAPAVTFSGGGGSGATATSAIDGTGKITAVNVTNPGSGIYHRPDRRLRQRRRNGNGNPARDAKRRCLHRTRTDGRRPSADDRPRQSTGHRSNRHRHRCSWHRHRSQRHQRGSGYASAPTVTFTGGAGPALPGSPSLPGALSSR